MAQWVRIQPCPCSGSGCCCGLALIPGPGTSTYSGCSQSNSHNNTCGTAGLLRLTFTFILFGGQALQRACSGCGAIRKAPTLGPLQWELLCLLGSPQWDLLLSPVPPPLHSLYPAVGWGPGQGWVLEDELGQLGFLPLRNVK